MESQRRRTALAVAAAAAGLAAGAAQAHAAGAGWFAVRYGDRITSADRAALDAAGARAVSYLPVDSYLAWLDPPARSRLRRSHHPVVLTRLPARLKHMHGVLQGPGVQFDLLVYGPRASAVRRSLARLGAQVAGIAPAQPGGELASGRVRAPIRVLERIARLPAVLSVDRAPVRFVSQDEGTTQLLAGNLQDRPGLGPGPVPGYAAWLGGVGLDGSGVRVSVVDGGIATSHPDVGPRVVKRVLYGTDAADGHGTHVAGIVGGDASAQGGIRDAAGFLLGQGVAPRVELIDQNAVSGAALGRFDFRKGLQTLSRDAVRSGAVAWNASWILEIDPNDGSGLTNQGYVLAARTMDVITRDADFETPAAEPLALVFAAGNEGPDESTMPVPQEAKNIITVASTDSQRALADLVANEPARIDRVSGFSSRGPALDGRILPTVAAPGSAVISARFDSATLVCGLPAETGIGGTVAPFEPRAFPLYGYCTGTSMAAPHVAGAVALVTQWWRRFNAGADPSPAMSKALLINTATDMGTPDIPNNNEGWGRVNLGALFDPTAKRVYIDQSRVLGDRGRCVGLRLAAADPQRPLKATLAWTDAPAVPGAVPALVNDLDLSVRDAGEAGDPARRRAEETFYQGNQFLDGESAPEGQPDRVNNIESIFLERPTGTYELTIDAHNIPGDGVPLAGDATDQDFALVVSNAIAQAGEVARCAEASAPVEVPPERTEPGGRATDPPGGASPQPPAARLAIAAQRRPLRRALRHGLRVRVGCSPACREVRTQLAVGAPTARRYRLRGTVVGTGRVRRVLDGEATEVARFGGRARRRLARARSLAVTVRATARDATGRPLSSAQRLVLRR